MGKTYKVVIKNEVTGEEDVLELNDALDETSQKADEANKSLEGAGKQAGSFKDKLGKIGGVIKGLGIGAAMAAFGALTAAMKGNQFVADQMDLAWNTLRGTMNAMVTDIVSGGFSWRKLFGMDDDDYSTDAAAIAIVIAEYNKELDKSAAKIELARAKTEGQAEQQRQIRDDFNKSFEERIAANERISELLEEQTAKEVEHAKLNKAMAEALYAMEPTRERYNETIRAEAELQSALNAIEGMRSEQLMNRITLIEEQNIAIEEQAALEAEAAEAEAERLRQEAEDLEDRKEAYQKYLDWKDEQDKRRHAEAMAREMEYQALMKEFYEKETDRIAEQTAYNNDQMLQHLNEAGLGFASEMAGAFLEYQHIMEEGLMTSKDAALNLASDGLHAMGSMLHQISSMVEVNSKDSFEKQKKLRVAGAIMDTFSAMIAAYLSMSAIPVIGPALGGVAAAAAGVFGFIQVAKIKQQQYGGSSSSDGAGGGAAGVPVAPQLNLISPAENGRSTLQNAIGQEVGDAPVKAYVTSTDMTSQQQLDRRIEDNAQF